LLFLALVIVIWFPLIILSTGLPGTARNPVINFDLEIGVQGWDPFYHVNQAISGDAVSADAFSQLRVFNSFIMADENPNTQILEAPIASESLWTISPPSKQTLINSLTAASSASLYIRYTLTRQGAINNILTGSPTATLNATNIAVLVQLLQGNFSGATSFSIPNMFSRYLRLPGVSGAAFAQGNNVTCELRLEKQVQLYNVTVGGQPLTISSLEEWWELRQTTDPSENPPKMFTSQALQVVTMSAQVPSGIASTLVSAGVIGLYVGVVLSIGRFLRMIVTDLTMRIMVENLPNCDELIQLCKDLFIARQYGDLMVEEELYWELIQIFRSPESLIDKTKQKQD